MGDNTTTQQTNSGGPFASNENVSTSVSKSLPGGADSAAGNILAEGNRLYNSSGQLWGPDSPGGPNPWQAWGLNNLSDIGKQFATDTGSGYAGTPFYTAISNFRNPISPQLQNQLNGYEQQYQNAGNYYSTPMNWAAGIFSNAQNPYTSEFNLQNLAGNTSGALTDTQQAILNDNAARIANRQASLYSGAGRYGSFGAGLGMARGIAETNNPLIASFNQQNIGNSLTANQMIDAARSQRLGIQGNATQMLGSLTGQMTQGQLNALSGAAGNINQANAQGLGWAQATPQFLQMATLPGQTTYGAGQQLQGVPWQQLQNYQASLSGLAPAYAAGNVNATQTGSRNGFTTNNGTTTTSQPTPWTTFAGLGIAGLGALMPSDRRVKTDIKKRGRDPWTNLNMYEWRYKGQPKDTEKYVGPMAQDVAKIAPDKVVDVGGILHIKA